MTHNISYCVLTAKFVKIDLLKVPKYYSQEYLNLLIKKNTIF